MPSFEERVQRAGRVLARVSLAIGALVLAAMLALTLADVAGRYLLNAPVNGKTELTRIMMAVLIACALLAGSGRPWLGLAAACVVVSGFLLVLRRWADRAPWGA